MTSAEDIKTVEEAREYFHLVTVHGPTLDDSLRPDFQLLDRSSCPFDQDGHCAKCVHFYGAFSEDGTFTAFGCYEGFCNGKNRELEKERQAERSSRCSS